MSSTEEILNWVEWNLKVPEVCDEYIQSMEQDFISSFHVALLISYICGKSK